MAVKWSDCKICFGIGKTTCMFCGEKRPIKMYLTKHELMEFEHWEEKIKFLKELRLKCMKYSMKSCGDPATDNLIIETIGRWVF